MSKLPQIAWLAERRTFRRLFGRIFGIGGARIDNQFDLAHLKTGMPFERICGQFISTFATTTLVRMNCNILSGKACRRKA